MCPSMTERQSFYFIYTDVPDYNKTMNTRITYIEHLYFTLDANVLGNHYE